MAKNLKLQIKNNQLAEVLKQNKLKKKPAKEGTSKAKKPAKAEPETKEAPAADKKTTRAIGKARSLPSALLKQQEEEKAKLEAIAKEEAEKRAQIEREIAEAKAAEDEQKKKEEEALKKQDAAHVKKVAPTAKEAAKTKPEVATKEAASAEKKSSDEASKAKKDKSPAPAKKGDFGAKTERDKTRDSKSLKRQAFQRAFDSRDKHGLRAGEEESWRRSRSHRNKAKKQVDLAAARPKELSVQPPISLKDLASSLKVKSAEIIEKLFKQGLSIKINDVLNDDTIIELIGHEIGCAITIDRSHTDRLQVTKQSIKEEIAECDPEALSPRAPVVAFMGHVDHGKTSLIDAIRKSKLAQAEAGAITQHIGAFRCHTEAGDITILDTPGHEAFTAIRSRGAEVTDIIVIVIAGDEGIKPQTDEAINQAKEAGVPIIVAINKSDKPGFNPDNVLRELSDREILAEAWGGETITVNCSAVTNDGIENLLEMLALQSEILELKANNKARARGTVLESQVHKGRGITATLLVQNGTLKRGDALLFECEYGRVKTMKDERGKDLTKALPSIAVEITGLSDIPAAGSEFIMMKNEKEAKKIATERFAGKKSETLRKSQTADLDALFSQKAQRKEVKYLNVILKADVRGSLEAVENALVTIPSEKAKVNIISSSVGLVSESDVEWAATSGALILGFHTQVEPSADDFAKRKGVKILLHEVIYHLLDATKEEMLKLLDKVRQENEVGSAEVKTTFKSSHLGIIAGSQVIDGIIKRSHIIKVFRDDELVHEGELASIKRHKDDVKEVSKGLECGLLLSNFNDIQEGDIIRSYEVTYLTQTL